MSLSPAPTVLVVQESLGQVVLFPDDTTIKVGDKPHEIEVTPDSKTAFVSNFGLLEADHKDGTPGTTISVLDLARRVERCRFALPEGHAAPHGLKLRPPAYAELFTNAEEGAEAMVVFDAASGGVRRCFALPSGVHNFIFSADGSALFAFTLRGDVCRMDPDTGTVLARVTTGSPRGLSWTAGFDRLIVSGRSEILLLHPVTLAIARRISGLPVGQIFYPVATPDGRWILAPAVLDGVTLVLDAATGDIAHRIESESPLLLAVDRAGLQVWIANVRVPAGMFGPDTRPCQGGVTQVDLTTFRATDIDGIPDANGLALITRPGL